MQNVYFFINSVASKGIAIVILILIPLSSFSQGSLPIVAVSSFDSTFNNEGWNRARTNPDNFEVMLETQLLKVGRFQVYERNKLEEILNEQGLQNSLSSNGTAIKIEGVDYLIYGSVTDFTSELESFNTGNFATQKSVTRFGVDVKISDTLTGEIRKAESIVVSMETGSAISTGNFQQSNITNSALVDAQRKAAKLATALLTETIFPIRVVDIDSQDIYLNFGSSILSVGDELRIVEEGKEIIDQDTGLSLGFRETQIAKVRVYEVNDSLSKAEVIEGQPPSIGDLAKIITNSTSSDGQKQQEQRQLRGRRI